MTQVGRGKPHDCRISTRLDNLKGIIDENPPKMDEQVVVAIIEDKVDMSSSEPLVFSRVQGGTPMKIRLSECNENKSPLISFDNFKKYHSIRITA